MINDVKAIDLKIMYKEEENIEPEFTKRPGTNFFRTPEGYFDSLEDRIMKEIEVQGKKKSAPSPIMRILTPVVGIAASLTLVYLLASYPFTNSSIKTEVSSTYTPSTKDDSTLNFSLIDENTLVDAIFSDEESTVDDINPDDMLAYLSTGLNEIEIYSEIQN